MSGVSPYHDAPGADITPPAGCKVTAASFLIRHSSIYANDDEWEDYMKPFVEKVLAARSNPNLLGAIPSSSPLSFLQTWESPINEDNLEKLTEPGRADAHSFGERFRELYSPLLPPKDLGKKHGKKDKKRRGGRRSFSSSLSSSSPSFFGGAKPTKDQKDHKKGKKPGKVEEPFKVWTASSDRDVETAKAWIQGAFPKYQEGKDGEGDGKYISLVKVPKKVRPSSLHLLAELVLTLSLSRCVQDLDWSTALTPHVRPFLSSFFRYRN
jgi:acid phosphatase